MPFINQKNAKAYQVNLESEKPQNSQSLSPSTSSTKSFHYYYPKRGETQTGEESPINYIIPVGTHRTKKKVQKIVTDYFQKLLKELFETKKKSEKQKINKDYINMDSASSSKIQHNQDESKEEIINEETMKGKEDSSDVEILNQRMLEIPQELIELLKKEWKRKESSFTTENSPMEENTTMPRIFRQERSPSPFSMPIASSTPFTSQRQNMLPKRVNIHAQVSSPLQQEIP
ncbi:hypothetical protein O181_026519 [Austropuccinia psidii MF-1]|uniref:Uncharacterized protein n=1 Tax=Austropuccinia psidii MF-1 TaxID=1389203 RepID=A0A9Q3H1P6_9BASI|nr:hypothetical protein [Austropuccinia psidii MF-1]